MTAAAAAEETARAVFFEVFKYLSASEKPNTNIYIHKDSAVY